MLIREQQYIKTSDPLSLIESMQSISNDEGAMCASMIPVIETPDHKNMVFYRDLLSLSEDTGMSIDESLDQVVQDNYISKRSLVVAIEEWRPLVDTSILSNCPNYVLFKEGTNSLPYQVVNEVMTNYMEDGDPFWFNVLEEAMLNEEFAVSLLEDQYKMSTNNLQGMVNSTQSQLSQLQKNAANATDASMKQKYEADAAHLQSKLKDMNSALNTRNNLAKSRASDQAGIPQNTATRTGGPMTKEEQDAKKAEIKARMEANKDNPKPNLAGTGGPAAQIKPAAGSPNNPTPKPSQQQQGWASRMWSSIKNWWNNTFGSGNTGPATPSNPYAQAAANLGKETANTWIDRLQATLSNFLGNNGMPEELANMAGAYAKGKANEYIDKGAAKIGG